MKFKIEIRDKKTGGTWWEEYDQRTDDARALARRIIGRFNDTLMPGENPREVVSVEVLDDDNGPEPSEHDWQKSNLVTIMGKGSKSYDTAKCSVCGITGKRYTLGPYITRDCRYKGEAYERCNTSIKQLEKTAKRRARKERRERR